MISRNTMNFSALLLLTWTLCSGEEVKTTNASNTKDKTFLPLANSTTSLNGNQDAEAVTTLPVALNTTFTLTKNTTTSNSNQTHQFADRVAVMDDLLLLGLVIIVPVAIIAAAAC